MKQELLKAYQLQAQSLVDILEEAQLIAENRSIEPFLNTARKSLIRLVGAIEPENKLAIAMIEDTENIECEIDQSNFLGNVAAAIINTINSQLEAVVTN